MTILDEAIMNANTEIPARLGPDPVLISRSELEALYVLLDRVAKALDGLSVDWIITGGSLLGAVRQHSILFTDDDVDIAVIGDDAVYEHVTTNLANLLGSEFSFTHNAWEGGDRVRWKHASNVFLDLFRIRQYETENELRLALGRKANGEPQPCSYVDALIQKIHDAAFAQGETAAMYPCWHFTKRKSVELWPKEVYRRHELYPIQKSYQMGPVTKLSGPNMPVRLLKRAFGFDCMEVYYQSQSHQQTSKGVLLQQPNEYESPLPPCIQPGGLWETSPKVALQPEHFIPTQPLARAKRRPTQHCYETLLHYLQEQIERETLMESENSFWTSNVGSSSTQREPLQSRTVYMDGVFDLFHIGHLRAIEQCAALGDYVIIGVTGDQDAAVYKRPPIISEQDRVAVIAALRCVNKVLCPCPLIVTEDFMNEHDIDLVVHGFANDDDARRQHEFFEIPMRLGKFQRIDYYPNLSTSDIIAKIQAEMHLERPEPSTNPKWFSTAIVEASNGATELKFTKRLCERIEPFIRKAADRRNEILLASRLGGEEAGVVPPECDFGYCTKAHPLRDHLMHACNVSSDTDLTRLHENSGAKNHMMRSFTNNWLEFQRIFTDFVLQVCAPRISDSSSCHILHFQSFPCLRVIQPNEFSIGPHADVAYGHHPCSINFYIPLTPIWGTASLFLESQAGVEDWHPIVGNYGTVKQFSGGSCLHFTPRNTTTSTRVSLDVRLVQGDHFESMRCCDNHGVYLDTLLLERGYYSTCSLKDGVWILDDPTSYPKPDFRMGFPWTIQNWDKYKGNKTNEHTLEVEPKSV